MLFHSWTILEQKGLRIGLRMAVPRSRRSDSWTSEVSDPGILEIGGPQIGRIHGVDHFQTTQTLLDDQNGLRMAQKGSGRVHV